ncbi:glycosyltransferase [Methylibium sp. Pch-M]|uniref:glycosyltransferase n=1 Tax=Methylibium sp. Pch-M TaxID=2082386 RepID=UPI0013EB3015|nr:glycosyltransferase [Methylibium sp. Pch-M]
MIFVTIGSMFPFDRLVRAVDRWAGHANYSAVSMQIGAGTYHPKNAKWVRTLPPDEFSNAIRNCDLMVAHLGMGSIISAMQAQKPVILLPRKMQLGEATSDHQLHGMEWLRGRPGVWIAEDESQMEELLGSFVDGKLNQAIEAASQYASVEMIEKVKKFVHAI